MLSRKQMLRYSIVSTLGIASIGCGSGGSNLPLSSKSNSTSDFAFGGLSLRAAATNPPYVKQAGQTTLIGFTGQIQAMDINYSLGNDVLLFSAETGVGKTDIFAGTLSPSPSYQDLQSLSLDNIVRITDNVGGYNQSPALSPDGSTLAFVSNRDGETHIWLLDMSTKKLIKRIGFAGATDNSPKWSPNGQYIAFSSNLGDINGEIYLYDTVAQTYTNVSNNKSNGNTSFNYDSPATFQPNGQALAFMSRRDGSNYLYIARFDGTLLKRIEYNTVANVDGPVWCPDGNTIAVTTHYTGETPSLVGVSVAKENSAFVRTFASDGINGYNWNLDGSLLFYSKLEPYIGGRRRIFAVPQSDGSTPGIEVTLPNSLNSTLVNIQHPSPVSNLPNVKRVLVGGATSSAPGYGLLGKQISGFLYASNNGKPLSILSCTATDFTTFQIKPQVEDGNALVYMVEGGTNAVAFSDIKYWNFRTQLLSPITMNLTQSGGTTNGFLCQISPATGEVVLILPFTAPNRSADSSTAKVKREGSKLVYEGNFASIWKGSGENISPQGAKHIEVDADTGKILSAR